MKVIMDITIGPAPNSPELNHQILVLISTVLYAFFLIFGSVLLVMFLWDKRRPFIQSKILVLKSIAYSIFLSLYGVYEIIISTKMLYDALTYDKFNLKYYVLFLAAIIIMIIGTIFIVYLTVCKYRSMAGKK